MFIDSFSPPVVTDEIALNIPFLLGVVGLVVALSAGFAVAIYRSIKRRVLLTAEKERQEREHQVRSS